MIRARPGEIDGTEGISQEEGLARFHRLGKSRSRATPPGTAHYSDRTAIAREPRATTRGTAHGISPVLPSFGAVQSRMSPHTIPTHALQVGTRPKAKPWRETLRGRKTSILPVRTAALPIRRGTTGWPRESAQGYNRARQRTSSRLFPQKPPPLQCFSPFSSSCAASRTKSPTSISSALASMMSVLRRGSLLPCSIW